MTKNELKSKVICWERRGGDLSCFVCFPAAAAATCYMFSLQYVTHMNIHVNIVATKCSMLSNERVTCSLCRLLHLGIFMEILSHVVANCANCKCYMFSLQWVTIMNIHVNIHLYHIVTIVQCCKVFSLQSATLMHTHVKSHQLHVAKKMFNVVRWTCNMISLHYVPPQQRKLYGWAW